MPGIVVAIAQGAFPIFPGFPPGDMGQPHQKSWRLKMRPHTLPIPGRQKRPRLQRMKVGVVMINARFDFGPRGRLIANGPFHGGKDQMRFRRMQIPAGWIHPQRPAIAFGDGFPGGKPERQFQKRADAG